MAFAKPLLILSLITLPLSVGGFLYAKSTLWPAPMSRDPRETPALMCTHDGSCSPQSDYAKQKLTQAAITNDPLTFITADGYQAQLLTDGPLTASKPNTLAFKLTHFPAGTKPLITPQDHHYGYVVLTSENPTFSLDTKPLTDSNPTSGIIEFELTPTTPGHFTLIAKFNLDKKNRVFTFPVDIK